MYIYVRTLENSWLVIRWQMRNDSGMSIYPRQMKTKLPRSEIRSQGVRRLHALHNDAISVTYWSLYEAICKLAAAAATRNTQCSSRKLVSTLCGLDTLVSSFDPRTRTTWYLAEDESEQSERVKCLGPEHRKQRDIIIIIINMISMVLTSWQSHCESSPGSFVECRLSAKVAAKRSDQANRLGLRVRQKEMAATVHIHHRNFIITQPESWYSFYRLTEGRRLSRHCSKSDWLFSMLVMLIMSWMYYCTYLAPE